MRMGKGVYTIWQKDPFSVFKGTNLFAEAKLFDGDQLLVHTCKTAHLFYGTFTFCFFRNHDSKMPSESGVFILAADVHIRKYLHASFFQKYSYNKVDRYL